MLHIVGNGPSRKQYDGFLRYTKVGRDHFNSEYKEWWGCNAIYTEGIYPDKLFCLDIPVQHDAIEKGVLKKCPIAMGDWYGAMEIEHYEEIEEVYKIMGAKIITNRSESDTHFIAQGEGEDEVYFTCYNIVPPNENIIMYNNDKLKNLFCGMSALGYAAYQGYKEITLVGFDALDPDIQDYDNALKGLDISSYAHKYTEEHAVFTIQKYQFVSLLQDDLFKDIAVYFKNPIDEDKKVVYNELTYYENSKERWVLGESSLFTFR